MADSCPSAAGHGHGPGGPTNLTRRPPGQGGEKPQMGLFLWTTPGREGGAGPGGRGKARRGRAPVGRPGRRGETCQVARSRGRASSANVRRPRGADGTRTTGGAGPSRAPGPGGERSHMGPFLWITRGVERAMWPLSCGKPRGGREGLARTGRLEPRHRTDASLGRAARHGLRCPGGLRAPHAGRQGRHEGRHRHG